MDMCFVTHLGNFTLRCDLVCGNIIFIFYSNIATFVNEFIS